MTISRNLSSIPNTITANTIISTTGNTVPIATVVSGTAKAWVNFNGTGTVAIRSSFNVSSITDNGTGDYTVNFTNAMPDTNYVTLSMCSTDSDNPTIVNLQGTTGSATTSSIRIQNAKQTNGASADRTVMCVSIFSS